MNTLLIIGGSLCAGVAFVVGLVAWALARVGDIPTPSVFDRDRREAA